MACSQREGLGCSSAARLVRCSSVSLSEGRGVRLRADLAESGRSRKTKTPSAKRVMHTTLPQHFYTDPDFFRAELERFYFNRWICAGRADQIPNPGDFFTRSLAGESVIVTRDVSGDVRAVFNVCRHRGTRLCDRAEGHFVERIQC